MIMAMEKRGNNMKKKIALAVLGIFAVSLTIFQLVDSSVSYEYTPKKLPATFEEYYKMKLNESEKKHVRPGNSERLVRFSQGKTEYAILYIHGYGASRAEGEYVVDSVAKKLKANSYYLRLPGHGTNKENFRDTTYRELLDESITALNMMKKLGNKTIVIGTSMGGLLATYCAANYPQKVDLLILASPFYNFASTAGKAVRFYPLFYVYNIFVPTRQSPGEIPPDKDNWTLYWYREQYFLSLKQLIDLSYLIAKDFVYEKVKIPVLLLYYYKDANNMDSTASVPDMLEAFAAFGGKDGGNSLNTKDPIANGDHVLLSKYVKADWGASEKAILDFVKKAGK